MKYVGLILVVVVALVASQVLAKRINEGDSQLKENRAKRGLNEKFRSFLEKIKTTLREGNSTLGIPVLDPFVSDKIALELEEDLVKGTVEATNFNVTGLSGYTVDRAEIALLSRKVTVGLTWPHIYSKGSYKLDVVALKDLNVYGDGDYTVTVTDLSFTSVAWIGISGGVSIKKLETKISLGALELSATGIYDDEDTSKIVSEAISDMAPQLIQDYQKELTEIVNEIAIKIVNEFLKGKSLSDIIAILG